jgi:hypothetical protein
VVIEVSLDELIEHGFDIEDPLAEAEFRAVENRMSY